MKVGVTGASGLVGFHVCAALHAHNLSARYRGQDEPYEIYRISKKDFQNSNDLQMAVQGLDAILHLAGVNRAEPSIVEKENARIAKCLVDALVATDATPTLVYSNSTQSTQDNPYGRGKAEAARILGEWASTRNVSLVDVIIPHVFGEGGIPNYNTVTATLCKHIHDGTAPTINEGSKVELIHAGRVADSLIDALESSESAVRLNGVPISVQELFDVLWDMAGLYRKGLLPDMTNGFKTALFNTYRWTDIYTNSCVSLTINEDERGRLFEAVKCHSGGQMFCSWTKPGVIRGEHFHRYKFERFLVLKGKAKIQLRRVFGDKILEYFVEGDTPQVVDIPTLYTHNLENVGSEELLTVFWTNEIFDRENPDTYAENVNQ